MSYTVSCVIGGAGVDDVPYEIERKFLIRRPDEMWLKTLPDRSEIVQTYLIEPEGEDAPASGCAPGTA